MKSKIQTEDESSNRAVSPVIGVILMVAITVILAAVIAAFVLDLGQGQSSNVNAGVDLENNSDDTVTFSLVDSGNAEYVQIRKSDGTPVASGDIDGSGDSKLENTGESVKLKNSSSATYTAVAVSGDDETQVGSHSP
ncbi:type IV pilin [Natronosalvus rutilus]|uniref:Type IV pilin N-terminal domain-containing protein n=1 Tax=Natronosalvus rutilus TaxID=2953753 RepID=A0A9E7SWK9_9EURY|nr:type IV pilin N-terminal domain-containing protein [Natronosalvus rutilus]UTF53248.1 type IV pilin N-terminal domain-containing protein [Natronosalvus rutilus]